GVYSVLAEAVSQRRREMGVRMAIGARSSDVLRAVFAEGLKLVAAGVVCGLVAAFVIMKLGASLSDQLHNVSLTDPRVYLIAAVLLLLGAVIGFLVPALRAARIDPVRALRGE
ncbi:MAG: FtsX-like permease family protein, partial [Acidobacteriota bacterium]